MLRRAFGTLGAVKNCRNLQRPTWTIKTPLKHTMSLSLITLFLGLNRHSKLGCCLSKKYNSVNLKAMSMRKYCQLLKQSVFSGFKCVHPSNKMKLLKTLLLFSFLLFCESVFVYRGYDRPHREERRLRFGSIMDGNLINHFLNN